MPPDGSGPFTPGSALAELAGRRVRGLSEAGRDAVIGLARGTHHAVVAERAFPPREVLALQAEGWRCVSLLSSGESLGPYPSAFAFCIHDIERLAKFFDPEHYRAQVGFFHLLHQGLASGLGGLHTRHDARFAEDVDAVGADTNGSPVFAFASLVMKLKMATRRALGRATGVVRTHGPLTADEEAAFAPEFDALADALRLPAELRPGALAVGARREAPAAARALLAHFVASAPERLDWAQAGGEATSSALTSSSSARSSTSSSSLSSAGASPALSSTSTSPVGAPSSTSTGEPAPERWRPTS